MEERTDVYSDDEWENKDDDTYDERALVGGGCPLEFEWQRRTKVWPSPSYPPPLPFPYSLPPAFFAALGGGGDGEHAHAVRNDELAALAGAVDDRASVAPHDHLRGALDV